MRRLKQLYSGLRFQTKTMIWTNLLIFIIFLTLYIYIHSIISQNIQDEVGEKALAVSEAISAAPTVINAFDDVDPSRRIQKYTDNIQKKIDAEFIVVGDQNEIRLAHPLANRIGKKMVGGDNDAALKKGESYISKKEGSIGLSIRGKTPIIKDSEVVGVVSVGYLLEDINTLVWEHNQPILLLFVIFVTIGMIGSSFLAHFLKKILHQMEPEEIAATFLQKDAILQSVKEGIIAVDTDNTITLMNETAQHFLQLNEDKTGHSFDGVLSFPLLNYAKQKMMVQDTEYFLNNESVLMNIIPLKRNGILHGAMLTFRRKTDLEKATKELSSIKQYSEGLRAQTHEFSNKIHTLYGLLQLHHIEEAKKFIKEELQTTSPTSPSLKQKINDPIIHGLLLAKFSIAKEKQITFDIDRESSLQPIHNEVIQRTLLLTLGNIIDNAFTASLSATEPYVHLHILNFSEKIIIEIDDNGQGVPDSLADKLFTDGVSTKEAPGHGKGLFLVKQSLDAISGTVFFEQNDRGGTRFVIIIPMKGET